MFEFFLLRSYQVLIKKIFGIVLLGLLIACSGSKDTSVMTPEEHYQYAVELYENEDYESALLEIQAVLLQYSGSAINDDAQYYYGMTYFKRGEYLLAAYEFSKLIKDIPASPYVPDSQFMLADCYYELSPPYQLDQAYSQKSIEEFQAFIDFFPLSPKVEEAEKKIHEMNQKIAQKAFYSAYIYDRMDYTKAAIKYYQNVFETYHDTEWAPKALFRKIEIQNEEGMKKETLRDITIFLQKFPDHEEAPSLQLMEQQLLEAGV